MRYDKYDVLDTLRDNRRAHKDNYRRQRSVWREEVTARYQRALKQFETGVFKNAANPLNLLPRPKHHLDDYDLAIERVEADFDSDTVHLSKTQYKRYMLDQDWPWSEDFAATKALYTG
jgi:hypothetical protein